MLGYRFIFYHKFSLQISCHFIVVILFVHRLLGQVIPLVSVVNDSLLKRSEVMTQLTKSLVDWQADSLAEANLELGQLMSELSVKHGHQGRVELSLLQVSLIPELLCHHSSNLENISGHEI